jgi:hypothetical protein
LLAALKPEALSVYLQTQNKFWMRMRRLNLPTKILCLFLTSTCSWQVFLVYSDLQSNLSSLSSATSSDSDGFRGLGYVDSQKDELEVEFVLKAAQTPADRQPKSKDARASAKRKAKQNREKVVEIRLAQDKTALRTRKGDTGSVVWKAR